MPEGPVLTEKERSQIASRLHSNVKYTSAALLDFPIIPFQIWAATYDLDIVLVTDNPKWNMHELARLQTPQGPIWIMKDALNSTMEQSIISDLPEIYSWLPEIPVERKYYPIQVTDRSTEKYLNLDFKYENMAGELCEIHYEGPFPTKKQPKRNGSTMGHSKTQLIAVLDLPKRNFAKKAAVSFDGKKAKIKKILGLVPFQMALTQTQAGISAGKTTHWINDDTVCIRYHVVSPAFDKLDQFWTITKDDKGVTLSQKNELRSIVYRFNEEKELLSAFVNIHCPEHKAFEISFFPALPDFSRKFDNKAESTFIMDVNGQRSHAKGLIASYWTVSGPKLIITPQKPWWVADRPMQINLNFLDNKLVEIISKMR
jgi:hypothetical protein